MERLILLIVVQLVSNSLPNTIVPNGIVIHHTALTREDVTRFPGSVTISTIESLHEKRGYSVFYWGRVYHAGYHYLILPNGVVQAGRPENCVGSHTRGHNNTIGICLVGNFSSFDTANETPRNAEPTSEQIRTLVGLIADIRIRRGIPCDRIYRHNDLNPATRCPGDRFPWKSLQKMIGCEPPR